MTLHGLLGESRQIKAKASANFTPLAITLHTDRDPGEKKEHIFIKQITIAGKPQLREPVPECVVMPYRVALRVSRTLVRQPQVLRRLRGLRRRRVQRMSERDVLLQRRGRREPRRQARSPTTVLRARALMVSETPLNRNEIAEALIRYVGSKLREQDFAFTVDGPDGSPWDDALGCATFDSGHGDDGREARERLRGDRLLRLRTKPHG